MRLSQLIVALPNLLASPADDPEITGVTYDSRCMKEGSLFVACSGQADDGHKYILQAVAAGAAAVVGEQEVPLPLLRPGSAASAVPYLHVANSREALGWLSAAWFGYPSRDMVLIGVTGTDGKTTTVHLIFHILQKAGLHAGMIGTVGAVIGGRELDTGFHVTTPDAPALQGYLGQMREAGLTHCVAEVTSHGLAQQRVAGCEFDIAAVTNITHEHLDYHGTFEAYRAVKAGLFSGLGKTAAKPSGAKRLAVLNADDPSLEYLRGQTSVPVATYSLKKPADCSASEIHQTGSGVTFSLRVGSREYPVVSRLQGFYNVSNILAASAVSVCGLGIDPQAAAEGVADMPGVPGRMERIDLGQNFLAVVDFAHTPNALRNALQAARTMTRSRVIAVFGSAGLRDREKRRLLSVAGMELADMIVLTAEDPRTESLDGILAEMAAGALSAGGVESKTFFRIPDRGEALRFAVGTAREGDLVIACGKGHEQSMCFGKKEYPWDDRLAMRAALAERLNVPGPAMLRLPTSGFVKEES